jgi:hypothetical protein
LRKEAKEEFERKEEERKSKADASDSTTYTQNAAVWYNMFNRDFKGSSTVKLLPFGVQKNKLMIRLSNMEDRFDG